MAILRIKAGKDTTIFSHSRYANAGMSEILSIGVNSPGLESNTEISRALIWFDLSKLNDLINKGIIFSSSVISSSLKIYHSYTEEYASTYHFELFPLSQSWDEGDGINLNPTNRVYDTGESSWIYRKRSNNLLWDTPGGSIVSGFTVYVTHSIGDEDFDVDITDLAKSWLTSLPNYGLLIKSADETGITGSRQKHVYSTQTNTNYFPVIEICWDDRITDDRDNFNLRSRSNKLVLFNYLNDRLYDFPGTSRSSNCLLVTIRSQPTESAPSVYSVSASWKSVGCYVTDDIDATQIQQYSPFLYDFWYSGSTLVSIGTCSVVSSSLFSVFDEDFDRYVLTAPNLKEYYTNNTFEVIDIFAREKYPLYTYSTSSLYELKSKILYNASYSILYYTTDEPIFDFSRYTALSYYNGINKAHVYFYDFPVNVPLYMKIKYERGNMIITERIGKVFYIKSK